VETDSENKKGGSKGGEVTKENKFVKGLATKGKRCNKKTRRVKMNGGVTPKKR